MAFEPVSLSSQMMSLPQTQRSHGAGAQTANTILGILDKFKKTPPPDQLTGGTPPVGEAPDYGSSANAQPFAQENTAVNPQPGPYDAPAPAQVQSSPYDGSPTFNLGPEPSRAFEAPALQSKFGFADVPKKDHGAFGRQLAGTLFSALV